MSGPADIRAFHAQRIAEFRANGGRLDPPLDAVPLLVLTTTRARTSEPRSTIMSYSTDGARLVVVAAKGGAPINPDWYHNLLAHPEVTVELGGESFRARALVAGAPERARLFAQHVALRPNFAEFQRQTMRQLPVVILERLG
jgi:deazaflavin-dependent oxidoreductase (nitroreductase family)